MVIRIDKSANSFFGDLGVETMQTSMFVVSKLAGQGIRAGR
jgi:hypothetical protein